MPVVGEVADRDVGSKGRTLEGGGVVVPRAVLSAAVFAAMAALLAVTAAVIASTCACVTPVPPAVSEATAALTAVVLAVMAAVWAVNEELRASSVIISFLRISAIKERAFEVASIRRLFLDSLSWFFTLKTNTRMGEMPRGDLPQSAGSWLDSFTGSCSRVPKGNGQSKRKGWCFGMGR